MLGLANDDEGSSRVDRRAAENKWEMIFQI